MCKEGKLDIYTSISGPPPFKNLVSAPEISMYWEKKVVAVMLLYAYRPTGCEKSSAFLKLLHNTSQHRIEQHQFERFVWLM